MYKWKHKIKAEFCRDYIISCIEVTLPDRENKVDLGYGNVAYCAKILGEKELAEVIDILTHKKEAMLKQHNFPLVYNEMLLELCEAQTERYQRSKRQFDNRRYLFR